MKRLAAQEQGDTRCTRTQDAQGGDTRREQMQQDQDQLLDCNCKDCCI